MRSLIIAYAAALPTIRDGQFRMSFIVCLLMLVLSSVAEDIWTEGEAATRKSTVRNGWYDSVKKDALSGNAWLSHFSAKKDGTTGYTIQARDGGEYVFWVRANPVKSELEYRIDGGAWSTVDFTHARGRTNIAANNKPDLRFIGWVKIGNVKLTKGKHSLEFHFHGKLQNHGAIDCFVLTNSGFVPAGVRKPSEQKAAGPSDWFEVVFDDDRFSDKSVIDMSKLVDAPAGKYGFLKREKDTLQFEKQGKPVKFWGCGGNMNATHGPRQMVQRARYLRKHGVNMIRQHTVLSAVGLLKNGEFDKARIDKWDRWFAELKKQGIYMTWSVTYPHHGPFVQASDGYDLWDELSKSRGLGNVGGLINIFRGLQEIQFRYVRKLLEHRNPYTQLRYADDPALAVLEIQNEDCVFFHVPLNDLRDPKKLPKHSKRFRQMFFAWAKNIYGTEVALRSAWGKLRPRDNWATGELETMGAYHLGSKGPLYEYKGQTKRAGDFIAFLMELQRGFYERREKEMRAAGFKGVTITTAWRAGGAAADPANLYCDTACDMIDRHNYFGGGVGGYNIREGNVNAASHLVDPGGGLLGIGMYQVEDRPCAVTEWTSKPPNQWKLEAAPLMAWYGMGLQGWDASYHFLNSRTRIGDGWPNLSSYVTDTPHYIGQFPALAFALYKGHIRQAPLAAARRLKRVDLSSGIDPLGQDFTGGGWDDKLLKGGLATPKPVLAIGRVTVAFNGKASTRTDFARYWNQDRKRITSMTGELVWDYGQGAVLLRTPKTQAVLGRVAGQTIKLPGVTVKTTTPFVSIIFTPLDDQELNQSSHILITAMARDRQRGAQYSGDGKRLVRLGTAPLLMEPVQARIRIGGRRPASVRPLDVYGVPRRDAVKIAGDGSFTVNGTFQTYYYEVKR